MKFVVWGLGKYFQRYENDIDYTDVIALIDSNERTQGSTMHGFQVQSLEVLNSLEYEYIIIFSYLYSDDMFHQLISEYHVPKSKIIIWYGWKKFSQVNYYYATQEIIGQSMNLIRAYHFQKILDLGMGLAENSILNREDSRVNLSKDIRLDAYNYKNLKKYPLLYNLYDHIYTEVGKEKYDLAAFTYIDNFSISEFENVIEETYSLSRYFMINIADTGKNRKEFWKWMTYEYEKWGHVSRLFDEKMQIILIDKEYDDPKLDHKENNHKELNHKEFNNKESDHEEYDHKKLDINIFVVTHKKFTPPTNKIYLPIQAGKEQSEDLGYLSDHSGDNISRLNPFINECTALYWIWKHTDSSYVGLNHYRRYFLKNELEYMDNILDAETVYGYMENYDFILAESYHEFLGTIKEGLLIGVMSEAVEKGVAVVRDIIRVRHTDYLDAFDHVFQGNTFYMCNMFITKREIMNDYCEWLFDIIIEAAETIDVSQYNAYSKRIVGFLAERLLTVWLLNNPYKIKELPIIVTE